MRLRLFSFLVLGVAAASGGWASAAETARPRFSLDSSRDGFVRLDTATGAVTHCSVAGGKWTCDTIIGGDAGLAARIDALALDVARLSAATAALDARVSPLGAAGAAASAPAAVPATVPSSVAQPRQATFAGRIVSRFLAMVRLLKHGRDVPVSAVTRS